MYLHQSNNLTCYVRMYNSLLCKKALEISFLVGICNVHGAVAGKFAFMNSRLSWHPDIKIYINTYGI